MHTAKTHRDNIQDLEKVELEVRLLVQHLPIQHLVMTNRITETVTFSNSKKITCLRFRAQDPFVMSNQAP